MCIHSCLIMRCCHALVPIALSQKLSLILCSSFAQNIMYYYGKIISFEEKIGMGLQNIQWWASQGRQWCLWWRLDIWTGLWSHSRLSTQPKTMEIILTPTGIIRVGCYTESWSIIYTGTVKWHSLQMHTCMFATCALYEYNNYTLDRKNSQFADIIIH